MFGIIITMDIQIKSSRAILATDSAVKKLKELKSEESSDDSFLRMGVKPVSYTHLTLPTNREV